MVFFSLVACKKLEQAEGETGNSPGVVTEDEITHAALTIAFAMLNPRTFMISSLNESIDICKTGYVAWDVEWYADMAKNGRESKQHEKLRKYFLVSPLGKISVPTTIVDNHGKILVWYLPDIMSPECIRLQDPLVTSASYSTKKVQDWLDVMSSMEFFWHAVTGAIAPDLFEAGSVAISETLVALDAIFSIKDLEVDLDYFPGMMCFICGKVLEHSVGPWKKGE
ncbi:hypothetical protein K503DRAFT_785883 [Rhizopogon vinicolor AM-OR11-026]|uniref:Uncharacterized protein n=1 Tax=Rhizopogon vinicolor AM-OR11-026 TaxID=1314800 RepID=A0A1B7MNW9_9AGAM|nr:hypothetical protein K503DRAFT_785883 [Rhizopogon vinicolor AM-OR11-026]